MTAIAIVGQGVMARAHARAWNEIGLGSRIGYICTPGRPVAIPDAPLATFVTDLEVVLADSAIGVLSVCTPTPTHAAIAIRALAAGKSVLLEKPIALTMTDALAIRDAAEQGPGVLMVAHVVRFFDGYQAVRAKVASGTLGAVRSVRAERLSAPPGPSPWWHDTAQSGGVLVDFAIHDFDQVNLMLGHPLSVSATGTAPTGPIEVVIDYADGGRGEVLASMAMPSGFDFTSAIEVAGDTGRAHHRFTAGVDPGNPYATQAQYFLECVRSGSSPEFCPTEDAITALAVALAARDSFASGVPEPVRL